MGNRHKAREFTLQILYAIDISGSQSEDIFKYFWDSLTSPAEVRSFTTQLVDGVLEKLNYIDNVISKYSEHWAIDRMTSVDRNILRMAVFELLFLTDIPHSVTINEAVEIGKKFGSEESGAFVNGILDRIARESGELGIDENMTAEASIGVESPAMNTDNERDAGDDADTEADGKIDEAPDDAEELSRQRRKAIKSSVAGKRNGVITLRKGETP